jgi:hypothetical protein
MIEMTTRLGICRTQSPSAAMVGKLRAWVNGAPVVAPVATFPGRRSGNGAGSSNSLLLIFALLAARGVPVKESLAQAMVNETLRAEADD